MRVVVSPDKFKGCLTAAEVADAVANGLLDERPELQITKLPVADGGDGTVAAALSSGFDEVTVIGRGSDGPAGAGELRPPRSAGRDRTRGDLRARPPPRGSARPARCVDVRARRGDPACGRERSS